MSALLTAEDFPHLFEYRGSFFVNLLERPFINRPSQQCRLYVTQRCICLGAMYGATDQALRTRLRELCLSSMRAYGASDNLWEVRSLRNLTHPDDLLTREEAVRLGGLHGDECALIRGRLFVHAFTEQDLPLLETLVGDGANGYEWLTLHRNTLATRTST